MVRVAAMAVVDNLAGNVTSGFEAGANTGWRVEPTVTLRYRRWRTSGIAKGPPCR
jgi:hypothetical protein